MMTYREALQYHTTRRRRRLGNGLFAAGCLLIVLRALPFTTRISGLPAFWYSNQSMWIIIGAGMAGFGWWLLWGRQPEEPQRWRPSRPGVRFESARLLVGQECHLCEDAAELLSHYQSWLPPVEIVEIHSDPSLAKEYCNCIPVLLLNGKVRFRGQISEPLLQRLIEGTEPQGHSP